MTLMDTIVRVSTILYSPDHRRNPRTILQLYNTMWVHHEMCTKLFAHPKALSREKLFGSYLHDLSSHAGQQYEIICLRSINAGCQERLFGQANQIALRTTNRQPANVIREVLFHLQFKQREGRLLDSVTAKQSKVSAASAHMPAYTGTQVTKEFIQSRRHSWQAHLERISNYLVLGPGVWWREEAKGYTFHDGDTDSNFRNAGSRLCHFRDTILKDVADTKTRLWNTILVSNTPLLQYLMRVDCPLGYNSLHQPPLLTHQPVVKQLFMILSLLHTYKQIRQLLVRLLLTRTG